MCVMDLLLPLHLMEHLITYVNEKQSHNDHFQHIPSFRLRQIIKNISDLSEDVSKYH